MQKTHLKIILIPNEKMVMFPSSRVQIERNKDKTEERIDQDRSPGQFGRSCSIVKAIERLKSLGNRSSLSRPFSRFAPNRGVAVHTGTRQIDHSTE